MYAYNSAMTPKQVIRRYGSQAKAATALGYKRATISVWVKNDKVPKHAQKYIASLTGGKLKTEWEK